MSSIFELVDGFPVSAIMVVTDAATVGVNASFSPVMPVKGTIVKVTYIPSAAVTANATNFRTLTIRNKGTNGLAGTTAVASRSWAATNSVLSTPEPFTLSGTPANLLVQAGDVLDLNQTAAAAGLIIPAGAFSIYIAPSR
jgi:hypothetical protein